MPAVTEVVERLATGHRVAIVTSNETDHLVRIHGWAALPHFELVLTRRDYP
jgi:hypothetical protein